MSELESDEPDKEAGVEDLPSPKYTPMSSLSSKPEGGISLKKSYY